MIVRPPGSTFAEGLTCAGLGAPNLTLALKQHAGYVDALRAWGIEVFELPPSNDFPDSTFVEDCAIVVGGSLVWTRPGADSRRGEVDLLREQISGTGFQPVCSPGILPGLRHEIVAPGTVDGGDICEMGDRFVIGISDRTNPEGSEQLGAILAELGFASFTIDICGNPTLLHLKTGLSYLGNGVVVCLSELAPYFENPIVVSPEEAYAANCAGFGENRVLMPSGAPNLAEHLRGKGFDVREVPMSEFQKMDGGISCLSLRFPW